MASPKDRDIISTSMFGIPIYSETKNPANRVNEDSAYSFQYNQNAFGNNKAFLDWYQSQLDRKDLSEANKKMLLANPYLSQSIRERGVFDTLSESILGTSDYMKSQQDLEAQARAYAAQYLDIDRQEDFESPQQQVMRELQAGSLPQDGQIDAGSTADFDNQAAQASAPGEAPSQSMEKFFSPISSVIGWFSGVVSMAQQFSQLRMSNLDYSLKELQTDREAFDLAGEIVPKTFSPSEYNESLKKWAKSNFKYEDWNGTLDELISEVNKNRSKDEPPVLAEDFFSWFTIDSAHKQDTSYLGRHSRRAMNKYLTSLRSDSPFVRSRVNDYMAQVKERQADSKVAETLLSTYTQDFINLQVEVSKYAMEAQKEYQAFQSKLWRKYNNGTFVSDDGTSTDMIDETFNREMENLLLERQNAITLTLQSKVQEGINKMKLAIMNQINPKDGEPKQSAWSTFKTVLSGSIPALLDILDNSANEMMSTWTSRIFSAPAPPVIKNFETTKNIINVPSTGSR